MRMKRLYALEGLDVLVCEGRHLYQVVCEAASRRVSWKVQRCVEKPLRVCSMCRVVPTHHHSRNTYEGSRGRGCGSQSVCDFLQVTPLMSKPQATQAS